MDFEGDAEAVGEDLGEGGGVALAVVERAGDDGHGAVGLEAEAAHFGHRGGGDFEVLADATAAELAAGAALGAAGGEAVPVGECQGAVEDGGEIAAVVVHAGGGGVGHLLGLDVVAAAELDAVDAHLGGGGLDQALHVVVALRPAGAAVGADGSGVGEDAAGADLNQLGGVDADGVLGGVDGGRDRGGVAEVGAEVSIDLKAYGEELAVLVEGELGVGFVIAAVAVGEEALGALVSPLHRAAELFGGEEEAGVLGVDRGLHAEGAADIAGEDVDLLRGDAEDAHEALLHAEDALAAEAERVAAGGRVEGAEGGAGLHGGDHDPTVAEGETGHVRGAGEGVGNGGGVAVVIAQDDVAGGVVMDERGAGGDGLAGGGDGGEGSMSSRTVSAASRAALAVSATTQTTGSPT